MEENTESLIKRRSNPASEGGPDRRRKSRQLATASFKLCQMMTGMVLRLCIGR